MNFRDKILEEIAKMDFQFNKKGKPYQSLPSFGIPGSRDTLERIDKYEIEKICKDKDVAIIGSNLGFLDIESAKICKSIVSIEPNEVTTAIQKMVIDELNIDNIEIMCEPFVNEFKLPRRRKVDIIISAAVHRWIEIPFEQLIDTYKNMLRKNSKSMLLIESHKFTPNKENDGKGYIEYQKLCEILEKSFNKVSEDTILDEKDKIKGTRIRQFSWWSLKV